MNYEEALLVQQTITKCIDKIKDADSLDDLLKRIYSIRLLVIKTKALQTINPTTP